MTLSVNNWVREVELESSEEERQESGKEENRKGSSSDEEEKIAILSSSSSKDLEQEKNCEGYGDGGASTPVKCSPQSPRGEK